METKLKKEGDNSIHKTNRIGFGKVCRDFMKGTCKRTNCKFIHDNNLCFDYWNNNCFMGDKCEKSHKLNVYNNPKNESVVKNENSLKNDSKKDIKKRFKKPKNTECFEPMTKPVDMRIIFELDNKTCTVQLTSRDVLVAPNIFSDFLEGDLYKKLMNEINDCSVPRDQLLKMWHGNDKIEGTHLIVNDRTRWKEQCPTFLFVIDRIRQYFKMNIQATRLNWYKDTSQWKPFHHDSAYVNPEKAAVQNFTVAVSFGITRDAAFEHATTKTVISLPHGDGCVYAFTRDTNSIWRHGILQDMPVKDMGRISVICWGWIDNLIEI